MYSCNSIVPDEVSLSCDFIHLDYQSRVNSFIVDGILVSYGLNLAELIDLTPPVDFSMFCNLSMGKEKIRDGLDVRMFYIRL